MKNISAILFIIGIIIVAGFATYLGYKLTSKLTYNLKYKIQVEQTIQNMVKPEALK